MSESQKNCKVFYCEISSSDRWSTLATGVIPCRIVHSFFKAMRDARPDVRHFSLDGACRVGTPPRASPCPASGLPEVLTGAYLIEAWFRRPFACLSVSQTFPLQEGVGYGAVVPVLALEAKLAGS